MPNVLCKNFCFCLPSLPRLGIFVSNPTFRSLTLTTCGAFHLSAASAAIDVEYQAGKVHTLKGPNATSEAPEIVYSFSYGNNYTEVFNALGIKTKYIYDHRLQLNTIEHYDDADTLYRIEQRFWGKTQEDAGKRPCILFEFQCLRFI
jgi:hypothetical protein